MRHWEDRRTWIYSGLSELLFQRNKDQVSFIISSISLVGWLTWVRMPFLNLQWFVHTWKSSCVWLWAAYRLTLLCASGFSHWGRSNSHGNWILWGYFGYLWEKGKAFHKWKSRCQNIWWRSKCLSFYCPVSRFSAIKSSIINIQAVGRRR